MLELDDLHKSFGDVTALDGLSLRVGRGQLLGFLGPNGAGKTTAMRTVFGLVRPDAGRVTWDGAPVTAATRRRFGYMPEERGLYPRMRVLAQLCHLGALHGMSRTEAEAAARRLLDELGLADRADSRLEELSHGNQQRVQLAATFVHDPELVLLDEPFAGLDPLGVETLADLLRARADAGTAVVFSSHQLDLVEHVCRDVVIVDHGRTVLAGPVIGLRARSPRRYLELELAEGSTDWAATIPGATLVARDVHRVRLALGPDADPHAVLEAASASGDVIAFSFAPPDLSEIFREAVTGGQV